MTQSLVGTIIGIHFGALALAALIFFLVWFFKRRHRLSKLNNPINPHNPHSASMMEMYQYGGPPPGNAIMAELAEPY